MSFHENFIDTFFCRPIIESTGYNIMQYLVYGGIMFFLAFWVIYPFFAKKRVEFNEKFAVGVLLFVLAGSSFRILEDLKILPRSCNPLDFSFYTITPGVYMLFGVLTIIALFISLELAKRTKKDYLFFFKIIGAVLALPILVYVFSFFKNWPMFGLIFFGWIAVVAAAFFILRFLKKNYMNNRLDLLVVAGQALDGTATFVATQLLKCGEQHPVSEAILGFFPVGFIVVKILIALLIIHFVEKEVSNPNMRMFIKVVIIIVGFAPGIRDALTVGVGTCG